MAAAKKKELVFDMSDSATEQSGPKKHSIRFDRVDGDGRSAPQNAYVDKSALAELEGGVPHEIELVIRPKKKIAARKPRAGK